MRKLTMKGGCHHARAEGKGDCDITWVFPCVYFPLTDAEETGCVYYATLEKQGISGENIDAAKKSIIRSLETLENAFRVQLDKLFSADALDAETDEDVLDTMLRRDGLAGRDFDTGEGAAGADPKHTA